MESQAVRTLIPICTVLSHPGSGNHLYRDNEGKADMLTMLRVRSVQKGWGEQFSSRALDRHPEFPVQSHGGGREERGRCCSEHSVDKPLGSGSGPTKAKQNDGKGAQRLPQLHCVQSEANLIHIFKSWCDGEGTGSRLWWGAWGRLMCL